MAYDTVAVQSVSSSLARYTVVVSADFSGADVLTVRLTKVFPWDYTDAQMKEWSVSRLEALNGLQAIKDGARVKAGDALPTKRDAIIPASNEPAEPGPGGALR